MVIFLAGVIEPLCGYLKYLKTTFNFTFPFTGDANFIGETPVSENNNWWKIIANRYSLILMFQFVKYTSHQL